MEKFIRILSASFFVFVSIFVIGFLFTLVTGGSLNNVVYGLIMGIIVLYIPIVIAMYVYDWVVVYLATRFSLINVPVVQILFGTALTLIYVYTLNYVEDLYRKSWDFSQANFLSVEAYQAVYFLLPISVVSFFIYHRMVFKHSFDVSVEEKEGRCVERY